MIPEALLLFSLATILAIVGRRLPQFSPPKGLVGPQTASLAEDFFEKGEEALSAGRFQEASDWFEKAVSRTPNEPRLFNRLGILALQLRRYRDALESFEKAVALGDKVASRHLNVGIVLERLGRYKEAARAFERAVKLEPKNQKYQELLKNAKEKAEKLSSS